MLCSPILSSESYDRPGNIKFILISEFAITGIKYLFLNSPAASNTINCKFAPKRVFMDNFRSSTYYDLLTGFTPTDHSPSQVAASNQACPDGAANDEKLPSRALLDYDLLLYCHSGALANGFCAEHYIGLE
jgi:hypothetical protein